jgi:hypothetical protein
LAEEELMLSIAKPQYTVSEAGGVVGDLEWRARWKLKDHAAEASGVLKLKSNLQSYAQTFDVECLGVATLTLLTLQRERSVESAVLT